MLRLDPARPPLWRSPSTLQFGLDASLVVRDPSGWQQRLLHALEAGVADATLESVGRAFGAPAGAATDFVTRIAPALVRPDAGPDSVVLQLADPVDVGLERLLGDALEGAGLFVLGEPWHGAPGETPSHHGPVVVIAHGVVEPRRASALMGADVPHLPIVFGVGGVEIGPFVVPGRTACLACVAAHRRDADPAWPLLAAQLLGRPPMPVDAALATESAGVAALLLSEGARHPHRQQQRSVTLRSGALHRSVRVHRPHAACRCRSLAGIATGADPVRLAPRSATDLAVPA